MTDRQPGTPDEPLPDATDATEPEAEVDEEIVEAEAEDLAAGDDAEDLEDEEAEEEAAAAGAAPVVAGTARERRSAAAKAAEHLPDRDRVSKIFVIVVAVAFSLILLNGIFAGRGGILTPVATETPIPSETVGPSPSAAPASSPSAAPSESPASSASPSAPASASPAPS
jgi:hypothetical protein